MSSAWNSLVEAYRSAVIEFPQLKAITLAQWMLESGRGSSTLATTAFNFGGLKFREELLSKVPNVSSIYYDEGRGEDDKYYFKCKEPKDYIKLYFAFLERSVYNGWREKMAAGADAKDFLKHIVHSGYVGGSLEHRLSYIQKVVSLIPEATQLLGWELPVAGQDLVGFSLALDCGHGEDIDLAQFDPGAVGNNTREYDEVIYIAGVVKKLLEARGAKVSVFSYPPGSRPKIGLGAKGAKGIDHDGFISIHNNAAAGGAAQGTETYHHPDGAKAPYLDKTFATILQKHMVAKLGYTNRGVKATAFGIFTKLMNTIPLNLKSKVTSHAASALATLELTDYNLAAVLVEPYFINWTGYKGDKSKVRADAHKTGEAIAAACAEFAIAQKLVLPVQGTPTPTPTPIPTPEPVPPAPVPPVQPVDEMPEIDAELLAVFKKFVADIIAWFKKKTKK